MPVLHSPLIWLYQSVSQNSIAVMLNHTTRVPALTSDICICIACSNEYHFNSSLNRQRGLSACMSKSLHAVVVFVTCFWWNNS